MSEKYNPARLLSVIPSHFLEEHALLLSRLGRHEEVLHIYVTQVECRPLLRAALVEHSFRRRIGNRKAAIHIASRLMLWYSCTPRCMALASAGNAPAPGPVVLIRGVIGSYVPEVFPLDTRVAHAHSHLAVTDLGSFFLTHGGGIPTICMSCDARCILRRSVLATPWAPYVRAVFCLRNVC